MSNELPWWQQVLFLAVGLFVYNEVVLPITRYIIRKAKKGKA